MSANAGIGNSRGDTDAAEQAGRLCEPRDGCEHWAIDDVYPAPAAGDGLFLAVFVWGDVANPSCRRPMPSR
jgi:hypothetical protein